MRIKHVTIIPSRGRAKYFLKYADLPIVRFNNPIFNTMLWVSENEKEEYKKTLDILKLKHITLFIDKYSTNIAERRQYILKYCNENNYEYLWSPDDDARFYDRKSNYKCLPLTLKNNLDFFNHLSTICSEHYPLVSVKNRFMVQYCKVMYSKTYKIHVAYFIHVPTFIKENISFMYKGLKVYEDRIIQLLLFTKGYRTCTSAMYALGQRHADNSIGGCSSYRTVKEANKGAKIIYNDFKKYTGLYIKTNWEIGNRLTLRFYLSRFIKENELNYVPKEEMKKFMKRKNAYEI